MLTQVCIDTNGGGVWRYDDTDRRYFRTDEDGIVSGIIFGQFLPDPNALWERRLQLYEVSIEHEMADKLKPQPATFALWKHWNEVKSADLHAKL